MTTGNHFFHLVTYSPWPVLIALNLMNVGGMAVSIIISKFQPYMIVFVVLLIMISFQWWRDVIREALYEGYRSTKINTTIGLGIIFFIVSEIWFFISFFWSYFYYRLSPDLNIGIIWPPYGVIPIRFMDIPLLNTLTLLTSGFFVTWSHHRLINSKYNESAVSLGIAIIAGGYFVIIQAYEYLNSNFRFNDRVFGNRFFILTGFHGIHVIVGLIFIAVRLMRIIKSQFSPRIFHGYEYSIWYWHFVDLVWLFLYTFIYWWGM